MLGRRRPEIPVLLVEGPATAEMLDHCGLDLSRCGNLNLMTGPVEPEELGSVARIAVLPELGWDSEPSEAAEALVRGIPVIGSDRGALPELLNGAGRVLPLPGWLTPPMRDLPADEEMMPWVDAILELWDNASVFEAERRQALRAGARWASEKIEPLYLQLLSSVSPGTATEPQPALRRSRAVILVPYLDSIDPDCEAGLRRLERAGVRVVRSGGNSGIDLARNLLASQALHEGGRGALLH